MISLKKTNMYKNPLYFHAYIHITFTFEQHCSKYTKTYRWDALKNNSNNCCKGLRKHILSFDNWSCTDQKMTSIIFFF